MLQPLLYLHPQADLFIVQPEWISEVGYYNQFQKTELINDACYLSVALLVYIVRYYC